jgi:hypothetical protein
MKSSGGASQKLDTIGAVRYYVDKILTDKDIPGIF